MRLVKDLFCGAPRVKERLLLQKPLLKRWSIERSDYRNIPNEYAHWHVDPPYNCEAGKSYPYGSRGINYKYLAEWCSTRAGSVDVCETQGATWLPFKPLYVNVNTARKSYTEVVCSFHNPQISCSEKSKNPGDSAEHLCANGLGPSSLETKGEAIQANESMENKKTTYRKSKLKSEKLKSENPALSILKRMNKA